MAYPQPTPHQQQAQLYAQLHHQRQQQPHQQQQPQPQQQQGITARTRDLADHDDHHRAAKRRKPTDRSLPANFRPVLPNSAPAPAAATDRALASSLDSLDALAHAYRTLQDIERKVDWTVARKAVDAHDRAQPAPGGAPRGQPVQRTLRIHVTTTLKDQPWQLDSDGLKAEGDPAAVPKEGTADAAVKVPRVDVRLSGEVLDEAARYPPASTPFTSFLHRVVVETPARDPRSHPAGAQPLEWLRPAPTALEPGATLPAALTTSHPLSVPAPAATDETQPDSLAPTLTLKVSCYLAHPAGDRYALPAELASALECAEADRTGVLEALWAYAKSRALVVEAAPQDGSGAGAAAAGQQGQAHVKSGIKTDERIRKFFGGVPHVQFHHIPEYINRVLQPAPPRTFTLSIPLSPASGPATTHHAFDVALFCPSPAQPAYERSVRALAALHSPASTLASDCAALDDRVALDALAVRSRLAQLHALQALARDPVAFLERWAESQAGSLDDVLAASSSGRGAAAALAGTERVLGARWRDEIRKSDNWDKEWVDEAVAVWSARDREGDAARLRGAAAQHQQQHAQQQHAQQQHQQLAQQQQVQMQQQMLQMQMLQQQQQQAQQQAYARR